MNGVMTPGVSAGSNHVGASETWTAHVICPSGPAVAAAGAPPPGGARLMRIPARRVRGAPEWGMALLESGLAAGFDFAYSYEIESWDELSVPLHFLTPEGQIPVAPVYTNCAAPPLPTPRRCHEA